MTAADQHDRFPILDQATACCLFGQFSGFDGKSSGSDPLFNTYFQWIVPTFACDEDSEHGRNRDGDSATCGCRDAE